MTAAKKPIAQDDEIEAYFARREQRQAPAWRPSAGATLKGEVIGLKMWQSEYGDYPVIIYRVLQTSDSNVTANSVVSVHAFHTILRERLAELKTELGSVQWLSYMGTNKSGKRTDKDGNPVEYHNYDVENDGDVAVEGKDEDFAF